MRRPAPLLARAVASLALALAGLSLAAARPLAAQGNRSAKAKGARWKEIGKMANGNPVEVDPRTLRLAGGIVDATLHVRHLTPGKSPMGPITTSTTVVRLDCAKRAVAVPEFWFWLDEAKGRAYQHRKIDNAGFVPALGGSMPALALDRLCAPGAVPALGGR